MHTWDTTRTKPASCGGGRSKRTRRRLGKTITQHINGTPRRGHQPGRLQHNGGVHFYLNSELSYTPKSEARVLGRNNGMAGDEWTQISTHHRGCVLRNGSGCHREGRNNGISRHCSSERHPAGCSGPSGRERDGLQRSHNSTHFGAAISGTAAGTSICTVEYCI